jgi:hypothetical protein
LCGEAAREKVKALRIRHALNKKHIFLTIGDTICVEDAL